VQVTARLEAKQVLSMQLRALNNEAAQSRGSQAEAVQVRGLV
jgi:hypothetical protein